MKEVIKIKDLEYTYPNGIQALRGIGLEVFENEKVALIGPNGAGKSTLLLHLNGILKGKGEVEVLGSKLNERNLDCIRTKVGLVFQNPDDQLFSPTVFDDVSFGPLNMGLSKEVVKERVRSALEQVEMSGFEARCPHDLSFGEKKKISLATVLSMQPEILVLDEPTSNLDPHSRRELIGLLQRIETTLVVATHDLEMVLDVCERVFLLFQGKTIASGKTRLLLANKDLMRSYRLEVPLSIRLLQEKNKKVFEMV
jgi:cobalt/nickel transport system ATP-binding protein